MLFVLRIDDFQVFRLFFLVNLLLVQNHQAKILS